MSKSISYTSPACSCIVCKEEFSQKSIGTHFTAKHTSNYKRNSCKGTTKFQLMCSCIICRKELSVQTRSRHYDNHNKLSATKTCPKCSATHRMGGVYCSRRCANSRNKSDQLKQLLSTKMAELSRNSKPKYTKVRQCCVCSKWFAGTTKACSIECRQKLFSDIGKRNAANNPLRSKDEVKLFELCRSYFSSVDHNKPIFNGWDADIIIYDLKIAVLWNGPWHYKDMGHSNHSLLQVQTRDSIKQKEIEALGWKCLIFEDRYYTPETAFHNIQLRALDSN